MSLEARKFLQDRIGSSIESLIQSTNAGMSSENASELIRKGAAIAAASEELGLSDEDVENMVLGRIKQDMMGRTNRNKYTGNRQSDPARRERLKSRGFGKQERRPARIGSAQDAMAVAERLNAALAPTDNPRSAVKGRGDLRTAEIGKLLEESEYPDPFGQDQGQYMDYRPDDRQYFESIAQGLREEARAMESGKVDFIDGTAVPRLKPMADPARYDEINMLLDEDAYNRERGAVAPPSVLRDALSRLNTASTEQAGVADAIGRLEDDLPGAPSVREAQQALVSDLVRADRKTFDPELIAANNQREAYRAGVIGRDLFTAGGRGAMADEAIAKLGQINRLGTVKEGTRNLGVGLPGATVGNMPMANNMNGIYVDPRTGQPIAAQAEVSAALAGANTPNSLQMLNAPTNLNTREFIATQSQAENLFEPGYQRQLDLTAETKLFADRLKNAQLPGGRGYVLPGMQRSGSSNVRSIDELDSALFSLIRKGKKGGMFFPAYEEGPDGNMQQAYRSVKTLNNDGSVGRVKRQPISDPNPGPMSALAALGYNPGEMTRLSQAMATIDAARRMSVNSQAKNAYFSRQPMGINTSDVNFNSPAQMGIKATVRDDDYQLGYTNAFKNLPGASRDATSGIYGQIMVPDPEKPGKMKPETSAGPRTTNPDYKYIYKRGGMGSGDELEANVIARRLSQGADMETAQQNARDARRAETNAIEAERKRRERMADPTPPAEPSSFSDPGYGDRLRLATQREIESQIAQRNIRRY
jgi:hypothetical protein